jgi:hypothetical protein
MELRFVQRLTWVGDEYARRYEVIIEKEEDGEYKRVLREFTTAFFIEISLPHGKYRYQVIPYDFFGLPVPVTEWMDFEVEYHEIIMVNPGEHESRREINTISPEPETAEAAEIVETAETAETVIEYKNQFDIYLGLSYILTQPIYVGSELLSENLSQGIGLRLAIVSAKQKSLNFGMEGSSSWRISRDDQPLQSLTFDLNLVMRYLSDDKAALNFRVGAGIYLRSGTSPVSAMGQYALYVNPGGSIMFWLPLKHLYIEAGMEYVQFFYNSGFLHPSIGLGFRF